MNITPVQNNNVQSFGMAYRMNKDAAKRIAQEINIIPEFRIAEDKFVNKIAKPLNELVTNVTADGEKVFIEHPVTKQKFEVLDSEPWQAKGSDGKVINYPLRKVEDGKIGGEYSPHSVRYNKPQNKIGCNAWEAAFIEKGIMRKHIMALEVGKDFDAQAAQAAKIKQEDCEMQKAIDKTTSNLLNLFG